MSNDIRNITIIAHVDHGKTTLIDNLMKQSGSFRENEVVDERLMDSGELEKERGITILAKPASINWKDTRINIIDTPGHRDFAAEVERVLSMADGALLLIDSAEGVMPQTKFVLSKALKQGLKPIVVINKLDKADQRANEVLDETFDLFVSLDANEEQLDFPVLYASGRSGWADTEENGPRENLNPLLDLILNHVKPANFEKEKPFTMLSTLLYADSFLGRSLVGRITQGTAKANQSIKAINLKGEKVDEGKLTKIFRYEGTKKVPIEIGEAGDIVVIAGLEKANVADTICDLDVNEPISATPIDPPTMSITITVNTSPLAGTEGKKLTSTQIRDRLIQEAQNNVGITFNENEGNDSFVVSGRGELMLEILLTQMRREGFELTVSPPKVLYQKDGDGNKLEPIEEITMDLDEEYSSRIIDSMNRRKGKLIELKDTGKNKKRLMQEAQNNVGITFSENEGNDSYVVSGRGELMLEILLTQMRREGFELTVSPPKVLYKTDDKGVKLEPIEEITMDLDEEYSSKVIDSMNRRKGKLIDLKDTGKNKKRLIFHAPTRGLMGYTSRFLTLTKGNGVINRIFHNYGPFEGDMEGRRNGALIAMELGKAVAFAIFNLQARGEMFVTHNDPVYPGMIVGLSPKPGDMIINVMKGKKLTNMRTQGTDENVVLTPVRKMSIAEQLSMLNTDEALEITPDSCRLRKSILDPHERKRSEKSGAAA